jgi:phospholipid/cholesterol/gamma-HCH transport system substrate-binding protein
VALAAAAIVAAVFLLGGGGSDYEVTAEFENASQLVKGNEVVVGGVSAGSVQGIELGDHGQALVTFSVADDYAPLRRGTTATVRSFSLSGIANRQVQLTLPVSEQAGPPIPDGGHLGESETTSEVDLDQVFNTLDPATIRDFKHVVQGFATSYEGVGQDANRGFHYLNPFLSTSRRLLGELSYDQHAFESLVVDTSRLSGTLAARAPDVSALVHNLDLMMSAIGRRKEALAEAVGRLPGFLRSANTTFVNLRSALDDLDPLVDASKPVAERLRPFLAQLRAASADAVPTIHDLDRTISRGGTDNDLIDLTRLQVPLARSAVGTGAPECGDDAASDFDTAADQDFSQGALGESTCALRNSLPTLSMFRPYTPDLVGWFDDFGHSGYIDAEGGIGRVATTFNAFSPSTSLGIPDIGSPIDFGDLIGGASPALTTDLDQKCPGANERPLGAVAPGDDSVPFTDGGALPCDPGDVAPGP